MNQADIAYQAIKKGDFEKIKSLFQSGFDANSCYMDIPLFLFACETWNEAIVREFARKGADIDAVEFRGNTSLHFACENGEIEKVKILVELGAKIKATNFSGNTMLIKSIYSRNIELTKYILDLKMIDINHENRHHSTALTVAASQNNTKTVELLLKHGASVKTNDPFYAHNSALGIAASDNNIEMMKLLFKQKVEKKYIDGALYAACQEGSLEAIELLINHGADISYKEEDDEYDAIDIAVLEKKKEALKILEKYKKNFSKENQKKLTAIRLEALF
jgi:ankyrin repeat protein